MRDGLMTEDESQLPTTDNEVFEHAGSSQACEGCSCSDGSKAPISCQRNRRPAEVPSVDLSVELEQILTDLEKNRFRECVAEVLGKDIELVDDFPSQDFLKFDGYDVDVPDSTNHAIADSFVYDSSSEESVHHKNKINKSSPLEEEVARFTPWREVFPPLYIHHKFPQRPLYWISNYLKHHVLTAQFSTA